MQIYGTFGKFKTRNEKTGVSTFSIHKEDTTTLCRGITRAFPPLLPLCLDGTLASDGGFDVTSIKCVGFSKEVMCQFLSSDYFMGIGPSTAEEILSLYGDDVFAAISGMDWDAICKKCYGKETIIKCLRKLKAFVTFEAVYSFLLENGGDYSVAIGVYNHFLDDTLRVINTNPYVLLMAGSSYSLCETMARKNGMETTNPTRISAIVKHALFRNQDNGNTRMAFRNLCKQINATEKRADCGYHTDALFIAEEIMKDDYHLEQTADLNVYLMSDYQAEVQIATHTNRIMQSATALPSTMLPISELETAFEVEYSEDQKRSFQSICTSGIKIITGGPGTGKTTVLNGILRRYAANNPGNEILLCAPTGCAARHMSEKTGRPAVTVHRVLEIKPFEKQELFRPNKLTADCIVVDETSMLDNFLAAQLFASIKNGALVILLGDKDQLPSVGAGNVLHDFIESKQFETYELTTIFRQASENLIVANSRKIIHGQQDLSLGQSFRVLRFDTEKEMTEKAVQTATTCLGSKVDNTKLYTPARKPKFASGTINLNRVLQAERWDGTRKKEEEFLDYGYYRYYVGDSVMFTKNNYDKGYYNGQEGVVTCIQKHTGSSYITITADGSRITLDGPDIADIELSYAITAHKSQGGECENAIILVPKAPASMLQRRLLYVEVTRAKKNVMILSERDALEQAISSYMERERVTGLTQKLCTA